MKRTIRVSLNNSGGELDHRLVITEKDDEDEPRIAAAAISMLAELAYLCVGDTLTVTETEG